MSQDAQPKFGHTPASETPALKRCGGPLTRFFSFSLEQMGNRNSGGEDEDESEAQLLSPLEVALVG